MGRKITKEDLQISLDMQKKVLDQMAADLAAWRKNNPDAVDAWKIRNSRMGVLEMGHLYSRFILDDLGGLWVDVEDCLSRMELSGLIDSEGVLQTEMLFEEHIEILNGLLPKLVSMVRKNPKTMK